MSDDIIQLDKMEKKHDKEAFDKQQSQNKSNEIDNWECNEADQSKYDSKQNINTIKTHFSIKNLYLPHSMKSEIDLERHIMDIFYKRYDMPLKYSRLFKETHDTDHSESYLCRIGFKYVTDAVKLFDKTIYVDFKLFPFKTIDYVNFEPSEVFLKYATCHKERMKQKGNIMIPLIIQRRSCSRNNERKRSEKGHRDSSLDRPSDKQESFDHFRQLSREKERMRNKKRRSSRCSSLNSENSFNKHRTSIERYRKKIVETRRYCDENPSITDEKHSCFLLGLAENYNITHVNQNLKRKSIKEPTRTQAIPKIEDCFNCNYYKLTFDSSRYVEKLVDQGMELPNNNILVLPNLESKTIGEMLSFHQVIVKGKDKNLMSIDINSDLVSFYRFFSNFGKIVDFNLEFFPNMIYITYRMPSETKYLLSSSPLEYVSQCGIACKLIVTRNDSSIYVRSLKDSSKSIFDNFVPRHKQISMPPSNNTFNPFISQSSTQQLSSNNCYPIIPNLLSSHTVETIDQKTTNNSFPDSKSFESTTLQTANIKKNANFNYFQNN